MRLVGADLESMYADLKGKNKRMAAEIAYALGMLCRRAGDLQGMCRYRDESVSLFRQVETASLDACCPVYESVNGVVMPSLIHEGIVVRDLG